MAKKKEPQEFFWPFKCDKGHEFELGPIHSPTAHLGLEEGGEPSGDHSLPGSGSEADVPDETICRVCFEDGDRMAKAHPVRG